MSFSNNFQPSLCGLQPLVRVSLCLCSFMPVPIPTFGRHSSPQSRASPSLRLGLQSPVPAAGRRTDVSPQKSPAGLVAAWRSRLRGPNQRSKGPVQSREVIHDVFLMNFTLRAGGSARMARPTLAEFALRIGPIWSRSSVGVVEPGHWKHPAGPAWWYRDVPSMCTSISPPYHAG